MSVYTKSNKKSWAEKGKVKFSSHARRDWPRYINVVIKATFHVSVAFPIIFTLLLLQFKRIPPCTRYSGEENSNKHPLRGNRFKMSQADSHPSCGRGLCHLAASEQRNAVWEWECACLRASVCVCASGCMQILWTCVCATVWIHQENGSRPAHLPPKIRHRNN